MAIALVIALSGSTESGADSQRSEVASAMREGAAPVSSGELDGASPDSCSARKAERWYRARLNEWRGLMGLSPVRHKVVQTCPRWLAAVLKRKAYAARVEWERYRSLTDPAVRPGSNAWFRAVTIAQRPYPGTRAWLLSCSASEGGWGRWVPNSQDSGSGGWMQFMESTFWRMWGAASLDVRSRGFRVPSSAASWHSPLGQALAGGWGVTHGRSHEWFGGGC